MIKQFYFLLILLGIATNVPAQIKLMGLSYDPGFGTIEVARWDAVSGNVLNTVPTTANGAVSGSAVHDAHAGKYYFRSPGNLVSVRFSPDTVQTLSPVELATSAEIDMANGKIFAVQPVALFDTNGSLAGSRLDFLEYNILNGTESTIGTIPNNEGVLLDASAYDSNTGTYYFWGSTVPLASASTAFRRVRRSFRAAKSYSMPVCGWCSTWNLTTNTTFCTHWHWMTPTFRSAMRKLTWSIA